MLSSARHPIAVDSDPVQPLFRPESAPADFRTRDANREILFGAPKVFW